MTKSKKVCCLKTKPFYQCCCKCEHLLKDTSHPTTDGKPISHQIGWICNAFAYEGIAHSGWTEHSVGCELYTEKKTLKKTTCPHCHSKVKPYVIKGIVVRCPECASSRIIH